ncbi:hypothetical protein HYC85_011359 [Camellia sinensis]|uniref:Uncharacterized protein n=1 Tax=Camellia sinensis TaxID=4442 RepID=A0A7J7HC42_CAMSI|nr:hypothetical protein HYC85_011359 [Camellia sinensis]
MNPIILEKLLNQILDLVGVCTLAFDLITSTKIIHCLIHLKFQSILVIHSPNIPKPTQTHKPSSSSTNIPKLISHPLHNPRIHRSKLGGVPHAVAAEQGVHLLLFPLDTAHAVDQHRFGFETDDARGIMVIEAEAEDGSARGELGGGAVEEDVVLGERIETRFWWAAESARRSFTSTSIDF